MGKNFLRILIATPILFFSLTLISFAEQKKIALIPFQVNQVEELGYMRDGVWDILMSRIAGKKDIIVVEKDKVTRMLEKFDAGITQSTARELGIALGVDFVVFGEIKKSADGIDLDAKMLDVNKGELIIATRSSSILDEVIPEINKLAANINKAIEGKPVALAYTPAGVPPTLPKPPPLEPTLPPKDQQLGEHEEEAYAYTEEIPIHLEADKLTYDEKLHLSTARGNVKITKGDMILNADTIKFNQETGDAVATGNVVMVRGRDRLTGKDIEINLDNQLGMINEGSIFFEEENFYIKGKEIEKLGEESYHITDGSLTTCDTDSPDWGITAKKIDLVMGGYARARDVTFRIKDFPVLYSPYLIYPVKTDRQTGLLMPSIGYSGKDGLDINLPFFWAISPSMDATFSQHLMSKRGFQEGIEFRYAVNKDSWGQLNMEYLNDRVVEDETDYGAYYRSNRDRWLAQFKHDQYFSSDFFTKADINLISDNDYYRDFETEIDLRSERHLESRWSITKNWETFSLVSDCHYFDDMDKKSNDATLQYLPRVTLTALKQPIGSQSIFLNLDSSYENLWRKKGMTGHRLDFYPQVTFPMKFGGFLRVVPKMGMRETAFWFDGEDEHRKEEHREIYDLNLAVSTTLSKIFDLDGKKLKKLKHLIEPCIEYTYVPHIDQDDLPANDLSSEIPQQRTITYSLNNTLIGKMIKKGGKSYCKELVDFDLKQSYNDKSSKFSSSGERRYFSDIEGDLKVRLSNNIYLNCDARYDVYDDRFNERNVTLNLKDRRGDKLWFDYRYQRESDDELVKIESLNSKLQLKVTDFIDFIYYNRYSMTDNRSLETRFSIDYRSQCWSTLFTYTERPGYKGDDRENKIMVLFSLYGLGPMVKASD